METCCLPNFLLVKIARSFSEGGDKSFGCDSILFVILYIGKRPSRIEDGTQSIHALGAPKLRDPWYRQLEGWLSSESPRVFSSRIEFVE
jgi:hypothetical protein